MSAIEFELIFVTPDLSGPGDPRIEQIENHLDVVVESHSGLTLTTVTVEGADAISAALNAAAVLTGCGLTPTRSYPDLVTRQDIADRAEVSRQAVGNWVRGERQQSDPFPVPANLVGGGVWLWGDVVAWLRNHDYETDDLAFPTLEEHSRIDALLRTPTGRGAVFNGRLELAGARACIGFAPTVAGATHRWPGFRSDYALAI